MRVVRFRSRNTYSPPPPIGPPVIHPIPLVQLIAGTTQFVPITVVTQDGSTAVVSIDFTTPGLTATTTSGGMNVSVPENSPLVGSSANITVGAADQSGNYRTRDVSVSVLQGAGNGTDVLVIAHTSPPDLSFGAADPDWWLLGAVGEEVTKRSGGTLIQGITPTTDGAAETIIGFGENASRPSVSWSGGTPTASGSNSRRGYHIWARGKNGLGLSIAVSADSTPRSFWLFFSGRQPNGGGSAAARVTATLGGIEREQQVVFPTETETHHAVEIQFRSASPATMTVLLVHDELGGMLAPRALWLTGSATAGWDGPLETYEHERLERVFTLDSAPGNASLEVLGLPPGAEFIDEAPGVGRLIARMANPNPGTPLPVPFAVLQVISRIGGEIATQSAYPLTLLPARGQPPVFPSGIEWRPAVGKSIRLSIPAYTHSAASVWVENLPAGAALLNTSPIAESVTNRIATPTFEAGHRDGWTSDQWSGGSMTADVVDGGAEGSSKAMRLRVTNAPGNVVMLSLLGTLTVGKPYTVSFWARAQAPITVNVSVTGQVSPWPNFGNIQASVTTTWQRFSFTATPTATLSARITVAPQAADIDVFLDNVSVDDATAHAMVTWTPASGDVGSFDLIAMAEDAEGRLASTSIPVTVVGSGTNTLTYSQQTGTSLTANLHSLGPNDWLFLGYENKVDPVIRANPVGARIAYAFNAQDWYAQGPAFDTAVAVSWSSGTPQASASGLKRGLRANSSGDGNITLLVPVPSGARTSRVVFTLIGACECTITAEVEGLVAPMTRTPAQLPAGGQGYIASFVTNLSTNGVLRVAFKKTEGAGGILIGGVTT